MSIELDIDMESYYTMVILDRGSIVAAVSNSDIKVVELRMELLLLELNISLDSNWDLN
jgi:hypothetical protein